MAEIDSQIEYTYFNLMHYDRFNIIYLILTLKVQASYSSLTYTLSSQQILWIIRSSGLFSVSHLTLAYTKQRWATCAALVHLDNEADPHACLFVGDRGGSVHRYEVDLVQRVTHEHSSNPIEAVQSFSRVHGKGCVTDMCYFAQQLYTCGRDGAFVVYHCEENRWRRLHSTRVSTTFYLYTD